MLEKMFRDPDFTDAIAQLGKDIRATLEVLGAPEAEFHIIVNKHETYAEITQGGDVLACMELPLKFTIPPMTPKT